MKWIGISGFTSRRSRRGFSLTELAIVLGVVSILLGGVWVVANQSSESARQEQLKEDLGVIVKNVRNFYGGRNGISGLSNVLTPQLAAVAPPVIPGDMLRTAGTCTLAACADHPWGSATVANGQVGSLGVCAWNLAGGPQTCTAAVEQVFAIELRDMTSARCVKAAMLNSGSSASPGFIDVVINGTSMVGLGHGLPVLASDAQTQCLNNSTMDFVYRLVTPQS